MKPIEEHPKIRGLLAVVTVLLFALACSPTSNPRDVLDFNPGWKFLLADPEGAELAQYDDSRWRSLDLPHDWSVESGFDTVETGASTGFLPGGIGWYRKHFNLAPADSGRVIWVEFDGIYRNSEVWINGHYLGKRPSGYSSFSYRLDPFFNYGDQKNLLAVRVDHSTYLDSRWYTGSGIYRNVRLVKTSKVHIPQWGIHVSTPSVSADLAELKVETRIRNTETGARDVGIIVSILDPEGKTIERKGVEAIVDTEPTLETRFQVQDPRLWSPDHTALYSARVQILEGGEILDEASTRFGIREVRFDPDSGFFLNGRNLKLKGVCLHHDAGCVGAAVPKGVWERRLRKLRDIGCNAIRTAHNPQDPVFLDLCDEMGFLVLGEAFDEWSKPKEKHRAHLSANDGPPGATRSYNEDFGEWAERDLKDMISRDFNHPSIILWSIGNEIEWTFPYYQQVAGYAIGNLDSGYYWRGPDYDPDVIRARLAKILNGKEDELVATAVKLSGWAKETDPTRGVTAGCVHPSVDFASGYFDALDVVGFNYRTVEYDPAHRMYPDVPIYGSENWVTWPEWKGVEERDFVAGIFVWTGFAYLGEAGPWPRKGLNISLFDFAGNQTPRGHLYESLWKDEPKVFLGTCPLAGSEFSYNETTGWKFTPREHAIPSMNWLRKWEWYDVLEHWNYNPGEEILVQAYTNCGQAELFLNGQSLGIKNLADFSEDGILKWIVLYEPGKLELKGLDSGMTVAETLLQTSDLPAVIDMRSDRKKLKANGQDVVHIEAFLRDEQGVLVRDRDATIRFDIEGDLEILGVENGSEYSVNNYRDASCPTYRGSILLILRSGTTRGPARVTASGEGLPPASLELTLGK